MKNTRRGLGKGLGIGYKNLVPMDSHIHSLSAKGCKTRQLYAVNMNNKLSVSEKIHTGITTVAKDVKSQLKKDFPNSKFSVTIDRYSMGQSLNISLMETDVKVIKEFKDIPEDAIDRIQRRDGWRTLDQIKEMIKKTQSIGSHQLNKHGLLADYDEDQWNNGVFLTKKGHDMLAKAVKYAEHYNYNHSDIQYDIYDVNFSLGIDIGKWDKPLIQQGKKMVDEYGDN